RARIATWPDQGVVDVKQEMNQYAFDTVMLPAIGYDPEAVAILRDHWAVLTQKGSARILRPIKGPMGVMDRDLNRSLLAVDRALLELIQRQRIAPASHPSFVSGLIDNQQFSDQEILAQLKATLFAGMETLGSALSFLWNELARHPEVRE